jgi:hypothetical protein
VMAWRTTPHDLLQKSSNGGDFHALRWLSESATLQQSRHDGKNSFRRSDRYAKQPVRMAVPETSGSFVWRVGHQRARRWPRRHRSEKVTCPSAKFGS